MIKNVIFLFFYIFIFISCKNNNPPQELIDSEISKIELTIKYTLGDEYKIKELRIDKEYFLNKECNEYKIEYSFIINKQFIENKPKRIKGYFIFWLDLNDEWKIKYNTIRDEGIINLIN